MISYEWNLEPVSLKVHAGWCTDIELNSARRPVSRESLQRMDGCWVVIVLRRWKLNRFSRGLPHFVIGKRNYISGKLSLLLFRYLFIAPLYTSFARLFDLKNLHGNTTAANRGNWAAYRRLQNALQISKLASHIAVRTLCWSSLTIHQYLGYLPKMLRAL